MYTTQSCLKWCTNLSIVWGCQLASMYERKHCVSSLYRTYASPSKWVQCCFFFFFFGCVQSKLIYDYSAIVFPLSLQAVIWWHVLRLVQVKLLPSSSLLAQPCLVKRVPWSIVLRLVITSSASPWSWFWLLLVSFVHRSLMKQEE